MKYRLDFVTNSSSSSFIFGTPGGHELTIKEVKSYVIDIAKTIYSNAVVIYEAMKNKNIDSYSKQAAFYRHWADSLDAPNGLYDGCIWDAASSDFEINKLKEIIDTGNLGNMICLWDKVSDEQKYELDEIYSWYADDLSRDLDGQPSSDDVEALRDFVNTHFGEVAITGECGDLPYSLAGALVSKLKYACNHMG